MTRQDQLDRTNGAIDMLDATIQAVKARREWSAWPQRVQGQTVVQGWQSWFAAAANNQIGV